MKNLTAESIIKKTITKARLIPPGSHIILGLSGGPDSVCLFHVLCSLRADLDFCLSAVHINHKFRLGDAEKDAVFSKNLCADADVTFYYHSYDVSSIAKARGVTAEEAGRDVRYTTFFDTAKMITEMESLSNSMVRVAVAHNKNDQAETVLLRILRGTGVDGLSAMPYIRHDQRGFAVIRPLLDVDRTAVEDYCTAKNLNPRLDHTNEEPLYRRNKLRLDLLPLLSKEYNSGVVEALCRLASNAAFDRDYFDAFCNNILSKYRIIASNVTSDDMINNTNPHLKHEYHDYKHPDCRDHDAKYHCKDHDYIHQDYEHNDYKRQDYEYTDYKHQDNNHQAYVHPDKNRIELPLQLFFELHPAVKRRLIVKCFKMIGLNQDIDAVHLRSAEELINKRKSGKHLDFPSGFKLSVEYEKLVFSSVDDAGQRPLNDGLPLVIDLNVLAAKKNICSGVTEDNIGLKKQAAEYSISLNALVKDNSISEEEQDKYNSICLNEPAKGYFETAIHKAGDFITSFSVLPYEQFILSKAAATQAVVCFDADQLLKKSNCLEIRTWRAGDWIMQIGMTGTKKLQDIFTDSKTPQSERGQIPLLALGQEILVIMAERSPGRKSRNYPLNESTKRVFRFEYRKAKHGYILAKS